MNNRQRMRFSNRLVRLYLLENGYDDIWFKAHTNCSDIVYTQKGSYLATDLYNLFDGMCYKHGILYFLQNKTNKWADEKKIKEFIKFHQQANVLVFNVSNSLKKSKGKYRVYVRNYE